MILITIAVTGAVLVLVCIIGCCLYQDPREIYTETTYQCCGILLTIGSVQRRQVLSAFETLKESGFVASPQLCRFMVSLVELPHGNFIIVAPEQVDDVLQFATATRLEWLVGDLSDVHERVPA